MPEDDPQEDSQPQDSGAAQPAGSDSANSGSGSSKFHMPKKKYIIAVAAVVIALAVVAGLFLMPVPKPAEEIKTTNATTPVVKVCVQKNFLVYPNRNELAAGDFVSVTAGIRNDAYDGDHHFLINAFPDAVSSSVLTGYNCTDMQSCVIPGGLNLTDFMLSWLSWDTSSLYVAKDDSQSKTVSVKIPAFVEPGYYMFDLVACRDDYQKMNISQCTVQNFTWSDCPQQLEIVVS